MHYYNFNIGDYKAHTEHLELMEDLAFRRMLDWCYLHEKALPKNIDEIAKLIRMRTHNDCIEYVLQSFFERTKDGYINARISHEVKKYQEKSEKAKKSAKARWDKKANKNNEVTDANALQADSEGNAKHKTLNTKHKTIDIYNPNGHVVDKPTTPPYEKIKDLYNSIFTELPACKSLNDKRKSSIRSIWRSELKTVEDWTRYFQYVKANCSWVLKPKQGASQNSLDWFLRPKNLTAVREGSYDDRN